HRTVDRALARRQEARTAGEVRDQSQSEDLDLSVVHRDGAHRDGVDHLSPPDHGVAMAQGTRSVVPFLLRLGLTIGASVCLFFSIVAWVADRPFILVDCLPTRPLALLTPQSLLLACIVPPFYLLRILSLTDLSLT